MILIPKDGIGTLNPILGTGYAKANAKAQDASF